jgi:hypothetical protein
MEEIPAVFIWIAGILLQTVIITAGCVWWFSRTLRSVEVDAASNVAELEAEMLRKVDEAKRQSGEAVAALREHVHSVEKFVRDNFVRRDSFMQMNVDMKEAIGVMTRVLEQRLTRIEASIDRNQSGSEKD